MTITEIQTLRDSAFKRLTEASAQSMSHKGRSVNNYELDMLSKEFEKWELQLIKAKRSVSGRPHYSVASF